VHDVVWRKKIKKEEEKNKPGKKMRGSII